jgi:glycosyltransferase involved in cell wall biosynthesis
MTAVTIVCCAEIPDPTWRWIEPHFSESTALFKFVRCPPSTAFAGLLNITRLLGSFRAVKMAQSNRAALIVTHGPALAAWCALFAKIFRVKTSVLAHSFNFTSLPGPAKRIIFKMAFRWVNQFVVFSRLECEVYSKLFKLPKERFEFIHWGVQPPLVSGVDQPVEAKSYVSSIGGNARDYSTLIAAAKEIPDIQFVLVVRPQSLAGLEIPANVTVHANLPFVQAMNILFHSRFMVLPLLAGDIPCGHVTLVAAMHLGKAIIATASEGIRDYVQNEKNALVVDPGSAKALAKGIELLWHSPQLCDRLGDNGRAFAQIHCTEKKIAEHFARYVLQAGVSSGNPQKKQPSAPVR